MPHVSLTRLRIRSIRFLPQFALHTFRSIAQIRRSPGFLTGQLLVDRRFTFWTLTAWDGPDSMRAFMLSGSHKQAMPHLLHWCDEASVAHWERPHQTLPTWPEADHRMREQGRASKVRHPSPQHATLTYAPPRPIANGPIKPA
jgi:hypothetical protein